MINKNKFRNIVLYPDDRLFKVSEEVKEFDQELAALLETLKSSLLETGGIGLSAIQIGVAKRVFIMREKETGSILEIINPNITHFADKKANIMEGCLSSPGVYGIVHSRSDAIVVKYQDREGKQLLQAMYGLDSVCFQHELDHLNGIFFLDGLNRETRRKAKRSWEKIRKKNSL